MRKKDITYIDKINELRLDITHPNNKNKVFVLLEGDSDVRLFRKLLRVEVCKIEAIPGGKEKLKDGFVFLSDTYASSKIIGIRDADFLNLEKKSIGIRNFFLTDYHDIEMTMILVDDIFSSIVFEFSQLDQSRHRTIREDILKVISFFSYVKWFNDINNVELNFSGLGFGDIIDFGTKAVDEEKYINKVLTQSPNAKITDVDTLLSGIHKLIDSSHDLFQLCNGHDYIKALVIYLAQYGDANRVPNDAVLSSTFRALFNKMHFEKTDLHNQLKIWSEDQGYIIL